MQIRQGLFIQKIEAYLDGRGRKNILKSDLTQLKKRVDFVLDDLLSHNPQPANTFNKKPF